MLAFAVKRLISAVLVCFVVSVLTFVILLSIGNPALRLAGRTANQATINAITRSYGFNKPIYIQYLKTMEKIFTGKIQSFTSHVNVISELKGGLPVTLSLVIGAAVIWIGFGIVLGLIAGYRAGSKVDTTISVFNFAGISAPSFVVGMILIFIFGFKLKVLPVGGYVGFGDPWQWFRHLLLPWICLAILYIGIYSQVLRSTVVETLSEDYVRTAKAKGLSERRIRIHHVLRTSLIPLVSLSGLDIASVLAGSAILIEEVFNLPGVGYIAGQAIANLDIPPILVVTLFGAIAVVFFSAIVDIIYAALDPRIRAT